MRGKTSNDLPALVSRLHSISWFMACVFTAMDKTTTVIVFLSRYVEISLKLN